MHRPLLWLAAAACAPPPAVALSTDATDTPPGTTETGAPPPSISFLYPLPGQVIHVTGCTLREPLIVLVEDFDVVQFGPDHPEDVAGEGHWHGGLAVSIDQGTGYCASAVPFCDAEDYDGRTNLRPGRQNLEAYLVTNLHQPIDPPVEATVEIDVVDDDGACAATTTGDTGEP